MGLMQATVRADNQAAVAPKCVAFKDTFVFVRRLEPDELALAVLLTRQQMGTVVASEQCVERIHHHNADAIWGIFQTGDATHESAILAGTCSFLLLNEKGAQALTADTLDALDPAGEFLCRTGERPAIIYIWSLVARKLGAIAIALISDAMGPPYVGQPIYARAGTPGGLRILEGFGYVPACPGKSGIGALYCQQKHAVLSSQQTRRAHRMQARMRIDIARTTDEVNTARAIRAAVFLTEQNCPFEEEFDGNDSTATHLIGYVDGEPAATMRIRYFADFVKLERLAVLPRFRRTLIARELVEAAVNFCRRKGYRKVYGHAQKRLVHFWSRFGFRPLDVDTRLVFSDHEYVIMWGELQPHEDAITMHSDPYLFLRPEGRWDEPCALDRSAQRPATNPH